MFALSQASLSLALYDRLAAANDSAGLLATILRGNDNYVSRACVSPADSIRHRRVLRDRRALRE